MKACDGDLCPQIIVKNPEFVLPNVKIPNVKIPNFVSTNVKIPNFVSRMPFSRIAILHENPERSFSGPALDSSDCELAEFERKNFWRKVVGVKKIREFDFKL